MDARYSGNNFGVQNTVEQSRKRDEKSSERAGSADVKESAARAEWGTNGNEGAKGTDDGRKGNEKGIAGVDAMVAAGKKMSKFVSEQNHEQGEGEGQAGKKGCGMAIAERKTANKFLQ